jgi:hypothetical protein
MQNDTVYFTLPALLSISSKSRDIFDVNPKTQYCLELFYFNWGCETDWENLKTGSQKVA